MKNLSRTLSQYFAGLREVLPEIPLDTIEQISFELVRVYHDSRTVYLFGNGGSAATASHFACDLSKGISWNLPGKRLRVNCLTDNVPLITAWGNDQGYDYIFAEQLRNFVMPEDVVIAISGSGNSPNVLNALVAARKASAVTIGLTGFNGGKMLSLCDICCVVPSDNMEQLEDAHLSITHALSTAMRVYLRSLQTVEAVPQAG